MVAIDQKLKNKMDELAKSPQFKNKEGILDSFRRDCVAYYKRICRLAEKEPGSVDFKIASKSSIDDLSFMNEPRFNKTKLYKQFDAFSAARRNPHKLESAKADQRIYVFRNLGVKAYHFRSLEFLALLHMILDPNTDLRLATWIGRGTGFGSKILQTLKDPTLVAIGGIMGHASDAIDTYVKMKTPQVMTKELTVVYEALNIWLVNAAALLTLMDSDGPWYREDFA